MLFHLGFTAGLKEYETTMYQHLYIFYSLTFAIYIVNVFAESAVINYILGLLAILMVIVSFPKASRLFQVLSGSFILIGGFFYVQTGRSEERRVGEGCGTEGV